MKGHKGEDDSPGAAIIRTSFDHLDIDTHLPELVHAVHSSKACTNDDGLSLDCGGAIGGRLPS